MTKATRQSIFLKYILEFGCAIKTADHFQISVKEVGEAIKYERASIRTDAYRLCWEMFQDCKINNMDLKTFSDKYTMSDEEAHYIIELGRTLNKNRIFTK